MNTSYNSHIDLLYRPKLLGDLDGSILIEAHVFSCRLCAFCKLYFIYAKLNTVQCLRNNYIIHKQEKICITSTLVSQR